jgi:two-component system, OmpR family, response regulator BaeR
MSARILIVEDEPELAALLRDYLAAAGFQVHIIDNGLEVAPWFREQGADLVILDLMLPGKDGLEIFRELREIADVPVVMATAKVEEIDRLLGLELGADDYICKPYSIREVVARVKMVLRRTQLTQSTETPWLEINESAYQVKIDGVDAQLTAVEFMFFQLLYQRPGCIFSRSQIMDYIYSDNRVVSERTVDSHVKKVRKKLQTIAPDRELIHSIYGVGYKLELG